jgi:predicted dehydrogenase
MADDLRIGFVGAGGVNFGGAEGPWDHATRLETIEGLAVVGLADPDAARAEGVLARRRAGPNGGMYSAAAVYPDARRMLADARPDAVFIGVPPNAHGGTAPPTDTELACAAAGVHMFIEKPLACVPPEELTPVAEALSAAADKGLIVSVGYMFRYCKAVEAMQAILAQAAGPPRAVVARYACAYSEIRKTEWWDVRCSGGPIVEQATHFVDLVRLLGGEADPASIQGVRIAPASAAAELGDMPQLDNGRKVDEPVPVESRSPRCTAAVWRLAGGGVASLTHGALLHKKKYESELEVWGDGLRMVLADPYGQCQLSVRSPHGEQTEVMDFAGDDPYLSEDRAFVQAVRSGDPASIRSTYADAMKTYELTWAIRRAGEKSDQT